MRGISNLSFANCRLIEPNVVSRLDLAVKVRFQSLYRHRTSADENGREGFDNVRE